ncbi:MAG: sigma-70 family RNA polymerase sigma factor [Deltaproteobacteria bacterium]
MATREEWLEVCTEIRGSPDGRSPRAWQRLYAIARDLGLRVLHTMVDREAALDLVHDLLSTRLQELLGADNPRALFVVAIKRRALDEIRRRKRRGEETDDEILDVYAAPTQSPDFVLDAQKLLATLSPRNRQIVVAAAMGEDRGKIALAWNTSSANVDKIVSKTFLLGKGP